MLQATPTHVYETVIVEPNYMLGHFKRILQVRELLFSHYLIHQLHIDAFNYVPH